MGAGSTDCSVRIHTVVSTTDDVIDIVLVQQVNRLYNWCRMPMLQVSLSRLGEVEAVNFRLLACRLLTSVNKLT